MVEDLRNGGTLAGAAAQAPRSVPDVLHRHPRLGRADRQARRDAGEPGRTTSSASSRPGRRSSSALSYPGVVMVLAVFTVAVLAGYVLPQFKPLFEELRRRPAARHPHAAVRRRPVHHLWYIPLTFFIGVSSASIMWMASARVRQAVQGQARAASSRSSAASSSTRSSSASAASSAR